ncbi:MAG: fimbrial protein [Serratia liquefaciens]|nr:fimbrial protein [Serratia liquefaciens]
MVNIFIWLLLFLSGSTALACSGCNQTVNLTLSENLTREANVIGHTKASTSFNVGYINTGYGLHYTYNEGTSFSKLDGSLPAFGTAPSDWVYQRIDDYFSVAVRMRQQCGYIYAPFNRSLWLAPTCQHGIMDGFWEPSVWDSSLRIDKKLVGGTYGSNILLGTWGGCYGYGCGYVAKIYAKVYLDYTIVVPENCEINSGQIISIGFGNISSAAFKTAGVKPERVNPQARTIGIKCNNIAAQANLTLRVQADNVSGDAIVSNNKDVGFVVTDANNKALTPNSLSSFIPFILDSNASANVTIKAYPVSVTGNKPTEGVVTSLAYLRVDFA